MDFADESEVEWSLGSDNTITWLENRNPPGNETIIKFCR